MTSSTAVLGSAAGLVAAREPFVLATVVWRRGPSSGRVGDKAIIHADGTVTGWLGGACAQPTVVHEALAALDDGRPRLLFIGTPDELGRRAEPGVVTVAMTCASEGAMEVYLEPELPPPLVVVVGRSPAAQRLASLAMALDWSLAVIDDGGSADDHPHPALVHTDLRALDAMPIDGGSAIVVATQGNYDELALRAALATEAGYVGLVASVKRADAVLALLAEQGVEADQLARVVAPAGLDLGPIANEEIAIAVMADLVARRAAGRLRAPVVMGGTVAPEVAVDPICGMEVEIATARYTSVAPDGTTVYFCAAGCQAAYERAAGPR